uniref:Large ribosomal subunit protein mL43 n=1 Tax=Spirometra erinaceieuropaei TaxID=99802 RepID=I6TH34_SPIER|nr:mitochondrial ribosomal protein L43 [Spirometra erinaceieuropaei]
MSGNVLPRSSLKAPLSLGVGRYICQLKRLTFKFCKARGDSIGVRDFIEKEVVEFARNNPSVVVYLKPRRHRSPLLVAEYLNGNYHYLRLSKMSCEEINAWVEHFRTRSGENIMPIYKPRSTNNPSIQGMWTPFSSSHNSGRSVMTPSEILANLEKLSVCEFERDQSAEDYVRDLDQRQRRRIASE